MKTALLLLLVLLVPSEGITSTQHRQKPGGYGPRGGYESGPRRHESSNWHQREENTHNPDREHSEPVESTDDRKECKVREYDQDKKVCVCDSHHCDTIPRPQKVDKSTFIVYTSNKEGLRFRKALGRFRKFQQLNQTNEIYLEPDKTYQTVFGFGGAFTDATGINILRLKETARRLLMESYFAEDGIEYNLCRVPIAGTDFSTRSYSYDDTDDPDPELKHFALQPEDFDYKIPFIKQAMELKGDNSFRLFASNWGAPVWMKTNDQFFGNGFIKGQYFQVWANYFLKFLEAYKKAGIKFWAITTQNQPSVAFLLDSPNIPTVGWSSLNLTKWVRDNLGPSIKNSDFSDTAIIILDDLKFLLPWYTNEVLADKRVQPYVSGIGIHWYFGVFTPCSTIAGIHSNFPDIFILSTEASNGFQHGDGVNLGSWERGEDYTSDIIKNMNCWVVGWVDWNMVLDLQGGPNMINHFVDAPIVVNVTSGEFYKQPMYYHLGHHSKFVSKDSKRIEWSGTLDENVLITAYQRPDEAIVVVILNKNEEDVKMSVIQEAVGAAVLTIGKRSINTILYWPD